MPLDEILQKIEEEAQEQERAILEEARKRAESLLKEADARKEMIYQRYNTKAKEAVEEIRRERISSATLEGRTLMEKAIEEIEWKYETALKEALIEFTKTEKYTQSLLKTIERSWVKLGPGSLVYVNPQDGPRLANNNLPLTLIPKQIDPIGGAIVTSADGRIYIDSTITELLRGRRDEILKVARSHIR